MKTHLIDWRPAKTRTVLFRIIPTKNISNYYYATESDHGILQIIMLRMIILGSLFSLTSIQTTKKVFD